MKINHLFSLLVIILIVSCEISFTTPERPVQEGTNYDISNKAWMTIDSIEYRTCSSLPYSNTGSDYYSNFMLIEFVFNCEEDNQPWREVLLNLPYFDGEGEYELGEATDENGWGFISYDSAEGAYITTEEYTGKVIITDYTFGDNTLHKVSGTYEFQARNDSLDVINLSSGVFTKINVTKHF